MSTFCCCCCWLNTDCRHKIWQGLMCRWGSVRREVTMVGRCVVVLPTAWIPGIGDVGQVHDASSDIGHDEGVGVGVKVEEGRTKQHTYFNTQPSFFSTTFFCTFSFVNDFLRRLPRSRQMGSQPRQDTTQSKQNKTEKSPTQKTPPPPHHFSIVNSTLSDVAQQPHCPSIIGEFVFLDLFILFLTLTSSHSLVLYYMIN